MSTRSSSSSGACHSSSVSGSTGSPSFSPGEAVESAFFAISVYDDDGRMVAVNKRAAELLGYDREELLRHDVGAFTEGGFDRTRLASRDMREGVRLVQGKDGSRTPVAFVVAPATLSGLPYFVAVWWRIAEDDPRASSAA